MSEGRKKSSPQGSDYLLGGIDGEEKKDEAREDKQNSERCAAFPN
jgi:hypothetical protein